MTDRLVAKIMSAFAEDAAEYARVTGMEPCTALSAAEIVSRTGLREYRVAAALDSLKSEGVIELVFPDENEEEDDTLWSLTSDRKKGA